MGRHRLSVALSSLRQELEPPGVPDGAVLETDRVLVGLNPATVTTDVAEFEAALRGAAELAPGGEEPHPAACGGDPPLKGREKRGSAHSAAAAGSGLRCAVRSPFSNSASRNAISIDCSALSRGSQNV